MARKPDAKTVNEPAAITKTSPKQETSSKLETPPKLDQFVPTGQFALVPGAQPKTLDGDSRFSSANAATRKGLVMQSVLSAAGTELPISAADLYIERLKILRLALAGNTNAADLSHTLLETKSHIDQALQKNLTEMMGRQRSLERSWRELDTFIKLARPSTGGAVALKVANISVDELCSDDSKLAQLSKKIPKSTELSMESLDALLVLPAWVGDKAPLKRLGELALDAKLLVISGVPESRAEASGLFGKDGTLRDIAGNARWQQQVVLVANDLQVRPPDPSYEVDGEGLFVSAATVLAGQIAKGDLTSSIASAQAGGPREILLGRDVKPRWPLTDTKVIREEVGQHVIPVAMMGSKLVFWGVRNLYAVDDNANDSVFRQYPAVRVRDYISKVLIQFMNSEQVFGDNTPEMRRRLKDTINEFLRANSGPGEAKMLEGGECTDVRSREAKGGTDDSKLDVDIALKFKTNLEQVWITLRAAKSDHWQEERSK